ncbi:hypothetical protein FRC11_012137, partial [Ceratobasidium sp. 423]
HQRDISPESENNIPGDTTDIRIALEPTAQEGYGRYVVQRLTEHAFNTLSIHRVTASVVFPTRPSYSATIKKQVLYNTKQLYWIFEKFGFKFEGINRGVVMSRVANEEHVWHDIHQMSILHTDYFVGGRSYFLSNMHSFPEETPPHLALPSPWVIMTQRHEEKRQDVESWVVKTQAVSANDTCDEDGYSGDETIFGGDDSDQDWDMVKDFNHWA